MTSEKYEKPKIEIIKFQNGPCCASMNFECTSTPILCFNQMENLI